MKVKGLGASQREKRFDAMAKRIPTLHEYDHRHGKLL